MKNIVIIGAGGMGREVLWSIERINEIKPQYNVLGFCDDNALIKNKLIYKNFSVLGNIEEVIFEDNEKIFFVSAIGNNKQRKDTVIRAIKVKWKAETIIDPSVIKHESAIVGNGTFIGINSILSLNTKIGNHVLINMKCIIGHDSILHDFVQLSPGSRISGGVELMENSFIGSNGVMSPYTKLGVNSFLSASSFSKNDIPDDHLGIGVPAKSFPKIRN